jgi:AraC-like DNA-binding protein
MQASLDGFYVPCSHVAILAAFARGYNVDMTAILARFNLTTKSINKPDALMLAEQYTLLLLDLDAQLKQHDFWFKFACQLDFPAYGVLGQALLSCDDLHQALQLLAKYYPVLGCGSALRCEQSEGVFSVNIYRQSAVNSRESIIRSEILVTSIMTGMQILLPDQGEKISFEFDYKQPEHCALYQQYLNNKSLFNAGQARLVIPAQYLRLPCPHANPVMRDILITQLDQILSSLQGPKSFVARVIKLITVIPDSYPSLERLATQLNLSPRTLSRRFKQHNTTFVQLVNQVKCQRASHYLENSNLSIEQIAALTGFSDSTNFRRAFSQWTGITPSLYRKQSKDAALDL